MSDNKEDKGVVIFGPDTPDGGKHTLRIDSDGIHTGVVHKERDSSYEPHSDETLLKTEHISGPVHKIVSEEPLRGPAKVSTQAYRTGWENIFGSKQKVGQA